MAGAQTFCSKHPVSKQLASKHLKSKCIVSKRLASKCLVSQCQTCLASKCLASKRRRPNSCVQKAVANILLRHSTLTSASCLNVQKVLHTNNRCVNVSCTNGRRPNVSCRNGSVQTPRSIRLRPNVLLRNRLHPIF